MLRDAPREIRKVETDNNGSDRQPNKVKNNVKIPMLSRVRSLVYRR